MIKDYGSAHHASLKFEQLTSSSLRRVTVIPQCLDNQWVPNGPLFKASESRQRLLFKAPARPALEDDKLAAFVRAEYLRALVIADQVVVNRAYLTNTRPIFRDYMEGADHRETFKTLIETRAIVPFLYRENNPLDGIEVGKRESFDLVDAGRVAWVSVCRETTPGCVRLDWGDEQRNKQLTQDLLEKPFHNRLRVLDTNDPGRFLCELRSSIEVDKGEAAKFEAHLRGITAFIENDVRSKLGRLATRNDIYKRFVIANGKATSSRILDGAKPFMAETKLLSDLVYNTNLTDALRVLTLTPQDSPNRLALQEDKRLGQDPEVSGEALASLIRDLKFAAVSKALCFADFSRLTLGDVAAIRGTASWKRYIAAVEQVAQDPRSGPGNAELVASQLQNVRELASAYSALLEHISTHYSDAVLKVTGGTFAVQVGVRAGAYVVTATMLPDLGLFSAFVVGEVVSRPVEAVTKVALGWLKEQGGELVHAVSFETARVRFRDARKETADLAAALRSFGFKDVSQLPHSNEAEPAALSPSEDRIAST